MLVDARLGPHGSTTTMSAVAVRGTVEMLSAPERVKVSTDVPSQPLSSTVYRHSVRPEADVSQGYDIHCDIRSGGVPIRADARWEESSLHVRSRARRESGFSHLPEYSGGI